jgi:MFS family permease
MMLLNKYGATDLFLTCFMLSLAALAFSCMLKRKDIGRENTKVGSGKNFFIDFKILIPSINGFLQAFVMGALYAFLPLYAVQHEIRNPGHFFSAVAATVVCGRILGGRVIELFKRETIITMCMSASMAAFILLAVSNSLLLLTIVGIIWGLGAAFIYPACMAYSFDYAGSSDGAAVGTFMAVADLGLALGPMVAGVMIPHTGYTGMFLCLGLTCLINVTYFEFYVRKRSRTRLEAPQDRKRCAVKEIREKDGIANIM